MIPVSKAFEIIDGKTSSSDSETIRLEFAVGRVLAENVVADTDIPPFDRSQMDGFAVVAGDTAKAPVTLRLVGESAAGRGWHYRLKRGEAVRIMTGAPVPAGADAVQKLESARENDIQSSSGTVTILETAKKDKFIVRKGSEIQRGTTLFASGTIVTEGIITGIAAFGYAKIKVAKKPRVTIMSTGSEIVAIDKSPGKDQIRNSNSLMLKVLCEQAGASAKFLPIAGDDLAKLRSRIAKTAEAGKTDILVITGGVSVGKYDLTKAALKELGAEMFFERVRLKPGKPAVFAKLGGILVFGLPGNPVSSAVTFYLFVRRAIRRMQNADRVDLKNGRAVATGLMKGTAERETYLPVALKTSSDATLLAQPLKWGGSSDFVGFARADALAIIPKGSVIERGQVSKIVFL
ncbi:MAG: molybdopterin molybdotransferase MoeA [Pyrinomonadaceae bacterium]